MKKNNTLYLIVLFFTGLALCSMGCVHVPVRNQLKSEKMTLGQAQGQIKIGMSGGQVTQILGSPNIVSTAEDGTEVWVYDKISSSVSQSSSNTGVWLIVGVASGSRYNRTSSQRTLTIIVNFDKNKKVRNLSYHSSSF